VQAGRHVAEVRLAGHAGTKLNAPLSATEGTAA
jgi:hypothetical protein